MKDIRNFSRNKITLEELREYYHIEEYTNPEGYDRQLFNVQPLHFIPKSIFYRHISIFKYDEVIMSNKIRLPIRIFLNKRED